MYVLTRCHVCPNVRLKQIGHSPDCSIFVQCHLVYLSATFSLLIPRLGIWSEELSMAQEHHHANSGGATTDLIIDLSCKEILWADEATGEIQAADCDGNYQRVVFSVTTPPSERMIEMTILAGSLYVLDRLKNSTSPRAWNTEHNYLWLDHSWQHFCCLEGTSRLWQFCLAERYCHSP